MNSPPVASGWAPTCRALRVLTGPGSALDRDPPTGGSAPTPPSAAQEGIGCQQHRSGLDASRSSPSRSGQTLGPRRPRPRRDRHQISDVSTGGRVVKATDNEIGGKKSRFAELSAGCSESCNVIDGAVGDGIDLGGDGGVELPASGPTTIIGNVFGATGSGFSNEAALPNGDTAIVVGSASEVTIGGPMPSSEGNHFVGGRWAVTAGPEERGLAIEGNTVGRTTSEYPELLEPPSEGAFSDRHAGIAEFRTVALDRRQPDHDARRDRQPNAGGGAVIAKTTTIGDTGIRVERRPTLAGHLGRGQRTGIPGRIRDRHPQLAEPGDRELHLRGDQGRCAGRTDGWTGGTEDYIGGNEAEEENEIEFSGGPAVEVVGEHTNFVHVLRNFGEGNAARLSTSAETVSATRSTDRTKASRRRRFWPQRRPR